MKDMKNKASLYLLFLAAAVSALSSCKKEDDFLPPDWNYPIPETALSENPVLGAYYINRTTDTWAASIKDHPVLNYDSDGNPVVYTYNLDSVLTKQCRWADRAGLDFFIFAWNNAANDNNLITAYAQYRERDKTKVQIAINYSFSHLSLDGADKKLSGSGVSFDKLVLEFKTLWSTLFSQEYYYRLADGRPVIVMPGVVSPNVDYQQFVPAFRQAMKDYTQELKATDPAISDKALDFYIIGEVDGNWLPPQRNEEASKYLNAANVKQWYPTRYYERWYCFYPYTDMAWQNWRDYTSRWGNDFVPCIFPEYYVTSTGSRSIERTEKNYRDFCNVAKRNIGKNRVILINSWNQFEYSSSLEPATEYGETYLDLTRQFLKAY